MSDKIKHDMYFHADKYKEACNSNRPIESLSKTGGTRHIVTGRIFINIQKIIYNDHDTLQGLPDFNARFNLVVSHEILHGVLHNLIGDDASTWLDHITVKYWYRHIDINTNQKLRWTK